VQKFPQNKFFGETVESIRTFDIHSQLSGGKSQGLVIVPTLGSVKVQDASLFEYLPANSILFMEEPELIFSEAERERQREKRGILDPERLESAIHPFTTVYFHTLTGTTASISEDGRSINWAYMLRIFETVFPHCRFSA
jgi:transcription-repair coupling factor (superfamily II helicase)